MSLNESESIEWVAPLIRPARLHALMDAFAVHGGTADGGMHRLALSPEDRDARNHLRAWFGEQELRARQESTTLIVWVDGAMV